MGLKKKSLLEQYIQQSAWMANHYNRVLVSKAREQIVEENGRIVRKYKKGKKLPKFRPGDRDNY